MRLPLLVLMVPLMGESQVTKPVLSKMPMVTLPAKSPIVNLSVSFRTGAAFDPPGKLGVAHLTARMLAHGGTREMTYKQILDAFFPMATNVGVNIDKELITFSADTHVDNLEAFYAIFRAMLLEPGWRKEDFDRLRDEAINYLRVELRSNNDEELGKEVLYTLLYKNHPYGWHSRGSVSSLEKMTIEDLKAFYAQHFTQANLVTGLAGGYPPAFANRLEEDFKKLPAGKADVLKLPAPAPPAEKLQVVMVEKPTRSVAFSLGFPIDVKRGHPDYPALLVMQSWLGQHRSSGAHLYNRMREVRGLNYGDYAYIEYFPNGMYLMEPEPNLVRQQQIFQIWIRPVERPTAHFALRLALYEFQKMVTDGLTEKEFEETRSFLMKNVNLLTRSKSAELGYDIDSKLYGTPDYNSYVKTSLAKLTRDDVNKAIRKHLGGKNMQVVVVADKCEELREKLLGDAPSPMTYNSPKPDGVQREDKIVENLKLNLKPSSVRVVKGDSVFE